MKTGRVLLCVLLTSVTLAACGGGGGGAPTAASTPTPTPAPPYAGSWRGTVGAGFQTMAFTVTDSQVTAFTMDASLLTFDGATFRGCGFVMSLVTPVAISGNTFTAQVQSAFGATTVRGTFTSTTAATGTFDAYRSPAATCDGAPVIAPDMEAGTWQATKS